MAAPLSHHEIRLLYGISLAVEPKETVEATAQNALTAYLQKLHCSGAAVFHPIGLPESGEARRVVAAVPERETVEESIAETRARLPDSEADVEETLPVVDEVDDGRYRYVMELPEFGVLLLLKDGEPLEQAIERSLPGLNRKLATACNQVAIRHEYETQYRELFEEAPVMFALTRNVGGEPVIVECNDRFAGKLGYSPDELWGRPLADLYAEGSKQRLFDDGYRKALEGEFGREERVLRTRHGDEITALLRASPRIDEEGNTVGTWALFVDVTESKRRKQQLSVLNRVLRHDIRNTLTLIQGRVELLRADRVDDRDEHLATIQKAADRLDVTAGRAREIQQLLDRSTITEVDVVSTAESVVSRARETYPDASVDLTVDTSVPHVRAVPRLRQAVWELVENACEHGPEEPEVAVTVAAADATVSITVADNGPGIPPHEHRVLGTGEETPLEHGSGLGLWFVYWVVDVCGGDVSFDCDDGTTATVELPGVTDPQTRA